MQILTKVLISELKPLLKNLREKFHLFIKPDDIFMIFYWTEHVSYEALLLLHDTGINSNSMIKNYIFKEREKRSPPGWNGVMEYKEK